MKLIAERKNEMKGKDAADKGKADEQRKDDKGKQVVQQVSVPKVPAQPVKILQPGEGTSMVANKKLAEDATQVSGQCSSLKPIDDSIPVVNQFDILNMSDDSRLDPLLLEVRPSVNLQDLITVEDGDLLQSMDLGVSRRVGLSADSEKVLTARGEKLHRRSKSFDAAVVSYTLSKL